MTRGSTLRAPIGPIVRKIYKQTPRTGGHMCMLQDPRWDALTGCTEVALAAAQRTGRRLWQSYSRLHLRDIETTGADQNKTQGQRRIAATTKLNFVPEYAKLVSKEATPRDEVVQLLVTTRQNKNPCNPIPQTPPPPPTRTPLLGPGSVRASTC